MKFTYTGQNGSCGFITGNQYELETMIEGRRAWLFAFDKTDRSRYCPYSTLEKFLENWRPIYDYNESFDDEEWIDF